MSIPIGFSKALQTFQKAAQTVPAYGHFLHKNKIDPAAIKTPTDFATIPIVTKENYLTLYPLNELYPNGDISQAEMISMSSGSSGHPFFWGRNFENLEQSVHLHDQMFSSQFDTRQKKTLAIIAFAMGTWIAGTYTLNALQHLNRQGHKITTISPGMNKEEIIHIIDQMSPYFEQIIILAYPPFLKDVLDDLSEHKNILAKSPEIKLCFAGENFSETWRSYVMAHLPILSNPLRQTITIYGTADAGMLGFENALSLLMRFSCAKNPELQSEFFNNATTLPTLVSYDPTIRYFELNNNYLVFTSSGALPLVRYQIMDQGALYNGNDLVAALERHTIPIPDEAKAYQKSKFMVLSGRTDVCTTFYALNIYPENIKHGLEHPDFQEVITQKFIARTEYRDSDQEQTLHIDIELKKGIALSTELEQAIQKVVVASLRHHNSEYNKLHQALGKKAHPFIHLCLHNVPQFNYKVKHRWHQKPS